MIKGLKIATTNSGIKYQGRDDLLLVSFENEASVAGVFSKSSIVSPTITWCQSALKGKSAKALIVNAGNANSFLGDAGEEIVKNTAKVCAQNLNAQENQIFISSTGVIGELFDGNLICDKVPNLISGSNDFSDAAKAIMTTDTKKKVSKKTIEINGEEISLIGIAKGSGMIAPNMATMLAYIFTDANISSDNLQILLNDAIDKSFNSITVDSDCSTNDSVIAFATKNSRNEVSNQKEFKDALDEICLDLAKKIVIDGEGATKLIEVSILGAKNKDEAKKVGFSIANSPLVKCAIAGEDPNWGRIAMAVGKSKVEILPKELSIKIGDYQLTKDGAKHPEYNEDEVHQYLKNKNVTISVELGVGDANATIYTCDLTEEYIKINKDYRS